MSRQVPHQSTEQADDRRQRTQQQPQYITQQAPQQQQQPPQHQSQPRQQQPPQQYQPPQQAPQQRQPQQQQPQQVPQQQAPLQQQPQQQPRQQSSRQQPQQQPQQQSRQRQQPRRSRQPQQQKPRASGVQKVEQGDEYVHVRFRSPDDFEMIRTPDWAAHAAQSVAPGAEVRTGRLKGSGEWQTESVLIPTPADGQTAVRLATQIVDKIGE